jgi:hypothetical protein
MRDVPFSAFLLLLIGVIGLAGFLTGNIWTWFGTLTGTGTTNAPGIAPSAQSSASPTGYAGNLRGSAT